MTEQQLTKSREYQALVIEDFKKRVYPLAMACAFIFAVFFALNILGTGKPIFIISDAIAMVMFSILAALVKRSVVPPYVGSIFSLAVILFFYITIILYSGSLHGMLFFYCAVPFFAFYMSGTRIGMAYGMLMLSTLLLLWAASQFSLLAISYHSIEVMAVAILLSFTVLSAWFFERTREKAFADSYQSGVRHETLMEALDEVYYRVGMDGIIQEIGEAIYALTGFSSKDVKNRAIETFYADPKTRDAYIKVLKENGSVKNYPIEILGKYGQRVAISISSRMFFDDTGKPIYIEGLIRDMTQEREIQKERTDNLQHLRNLSVIEATLSEQDFEVGLQSAVKDIQIIFAAQHAFLSPLCFNPDGELDGSYKTVFTTEPEQELMFSLKALMCESEMITYASSVPERQLKTPLMLDVQAIFSPGLILKYHLLPGLMLLLRVKSDVLWVLAIKQDKDIDYSEQQKRLLVDISHRVRGALSQLILQKDLQATVERVEIASHAKSEFLATMSHELRTPLHGVIGLLDLLSEDMKHLSSEQQRNLMLAQTSSQVLSSLIDDVLDLAKIESGKVEIQKQSFYLHDALHDALVPFVMKAREKGLNLNLEMKDVAAVVEGDVVRLRQVLLNLVGNAIKFTMEGYVRIVVTQDDGMLQVNIEDSGIGIDKMKQGVVFQPFTQVHDVHILGDNLQEKGTGLGTTIAQHFVEMMGGTLTLQSEPNIGSTMSIRLPLQQVGEQKITENLDMVDFSGYGKNATLADINAHQVEPETWSVLLAEDDPVGRRIALKRLQGAGFDVEEVNDGLAAWDKIQAQDFDLLLTDIRMPGLDGMGLTQKIREYEAAQGKKAMLIIGLSAYALEEVKNDALACGMNAFVSKPVDMSVLMKKLEEHCESEYPHKGLRT
ncbi:MAG: ATP-binding protein [Ghiorsea sp.]|nr:ATP-binding protein [Ghiorsea sp.]